MRFFRKPETQDGIRRDAVEWVRRLAEDDVTEEDQARFAEWLRTSPQHEREFLLANAFTQLTAQLRGCRRSSSRPRVCAYLLVAACLLVVVIGALVTTFASR
jgi:ferric-dicitrate binding protein FerR (iron transport regulator)